MNQTSHSPSGARKVQFAASFGTRTRYCSSNTPRRPDAAFLRAEYGRIWAGSDPGRGIHFYGNDSPSILLHVQHNVPPHLVWPYNITLETAHHISPSSFG